MAAIVGSPVAAAQGSVNYNPTISLTVPATTVGNLIVLVILYNTEGRTLSSVSAGASGGTVYHDHTGNERVIIWAGIADSSITTVSATLSSSSVGPDHLTFYEFSGMANPIVEEGTSSGTTTASGTTHTSGTVTPANPCVYILGFISTGSTGGWVSRDADFTDAFTPSSVFYSGYRIDNAGAAQNWTGQITNSRTAEVVLAAFRQSASTVNAPRTFHLMQQGIA